MSGFGAVSICAEDIMEVPSAPQNLKINTSVHGIILSWEDTQDVTYNLYRMNNLYDNDWVIIAESLSEKSFVDTVVRMGETGYVVTSVNSDGESIHSDYAGIVIDGIEDLSPNNMKVSISPNPATEQINITLAANLTNTVSISISDIIGNVLIQKDIQPYELNGSLSLDISVLVAGNYFLTVVSADKLFRSKFVKID